MRTGWYENPMGVRLNVVEPVVGTVAGFKTLGMLWIAESEYEPFFGVDYYIVTQTSMDGAGYTYVGPQP